MNLFGHSSIRIFTMSLRTNSPEGRLGDSVRFRKTKSLRGQAKSLQLEMCPILITFALSVRKHLPGDGGDRFTTTNSMED